MTLSRSTEVTEDDREKVLAFGGTQRRLPDLEGTEPTRRDFRPPRASGETVPALEGEHVGGHVWFRFSRVSWLFLGC